MANLLGEEPETFQGAPSLAACPRRLGDIGDDAAGGDTQIIIAVSSSTLQTRR